MPEGSVAIRRGLDPRTKLLLVVLVSATVMTPGGWPFVPAAFLLGLGLALGQAAWWRAIVLSAATITLWLFAGPVPGWWRHPVTAVLAVGANFAIRFTVAIGVGMALLAGTTATALYTALRAWKAPRSLVVTIAVMLRYFPVVAHESAAVLDAMRLRGLAGFGGFWRNPVLAVERFTVPMIAASLRAGEDLSASAILRGLGSTTTPTTICPPRFGLLDLAVLTGILAMIGLTTLLVGPVL